MLKPPASQSEPPRQMRIVFVLTVGIERPSGRRYFNIARELVRRGCAVRLLALHPDLATCTRRRFVQDGVEVWYVGQMHARKSGSQPHRFGSLHLLRVVVAATWGLLRGILASPADVYHLGKPQPINGMAALIGVLLVRRQPFYLDCDDDETATNRFTAAWQRQVFGFWQALLPRLACGITVNTHHLEQRLRPYSRAPLCYVPNGITPDSFRAPPAHIVAGLRAALGLAQQPVIAYVGTLALHNHPVDLLLEAFALLRAQHPTARLLLIGGGEDLPLLRQQAAALGVQQAVLFTGQVPHHSIPAYLSLATVSVDPVYDNAVARARSPLKIAESMVLGVPVVSSPVGDRAAMLDEGRAGVLVAAGSAPALADGLARVLADAAYRQRMSQHARQHVVRRYTWEQLGAQWAAVYAMPHNTPAVPQEVLP